MGKIAKLDKERDYQILKETGLFSAGDVIDLGMDFIDVSSLNEEIKKITIPKGKKLQVKLAVGIRLLDESKIKDRSDDVVKKVLEKNISLKHLGV